MKDLHLTCTDGTVHMPFDHIIHNKTLDSMISDVMVTGWSNNVPIPFNCETVNHLIQMTKLQMHNIHIQDMDSYKDLKWRDNLHSTEKNYLDSLVNVNDDCPVERKWDAIGNLAIISDFLHNQKAFDACIKYIAGVLDTQSVETLCKILQVDNDLTEKEREEIRKYNMWCDEDAPV
jgi:hypothetical protein